MNIIELTWAKYKEWVTDTVRGNAQYCCRGQQNPKWKLQTSFHRFPNETGTSLQDYFNRIIPEVGYYASAYHNEIIDTTNATQLAILLSRLQHHGFPTPLLDWSLSPYVAAYFAYKDIDPRKHSGPTVAVYVFHIHHWSTFHSSPIYLNQNENYVSDFRPHANRNPRMVRQMAVTTATNVSIVEDYIISEENRLNQPFLWKVILPVSERRIVMNELNLMGINSMTMFPDFDGICSSMKEKHFNNVDVLPLIPPPPTK